MGGAAYENMDAGLMKKPRTGLTALGFGKAMHVHGGCIYNTLDRKLESLSGGRTGRVYAQI